MRSEIMLSAAQLYTYFVQHPVVCTDSRTITPGCLFFALKGDKFDGNQYALRAIAGGAAYAVVDDNTLGTHPQLLYVEDVLKALQDLALYHRRTFLIPVIAIGGSNGKTTTKELVAAVLSSHYPCHFTRGNFNNHIGVPLTLLAMPKETEVAIIEIGANHPGEIAQLCEIVEPTHGLITNIGKEHLEGFGDLEGVKKAEGELYAYLHKTGGCVFVNGSEKYLNTMARRIRRKVVYAEANSLLKREESFVEVQLIRQIPFVEAAFLAENNVPVEVHSRLFGRHNFFNIMSALALGTYFKVPAEKIKSSIENYKPANNRSQIETRDSNTFILDAYNANPSSMEVAIKSFAAMEAANKVAVLGDMLELGQESEKEHIRILRLAAHKRFTHLLIVGAEFGKVNQKRFKALYFDDANEAKTWIENQNMTETLFLVKGSRGIRLEGVLPGAPLSIH